MADINNDRRADAAAAAIVAYSLFKGDAPDCEDQVTLAGDLLCDLLHLIKRELPKSWLADCRKDLTPRELLELKHSGALECFDEECLEEEGE